MNEEEAYKLLTLASARDNRSVSQFIAAVWASDLRSVAFADGVDALTLFYQEQPNVWLKPGHVIADARRVRETRAVDRGPAYCPDHPGYPDPCHACAEVTC